MIDSSRASMLSKLAAETSLCGIAAMALFSPFLMINNIVVVRAALTGRPPTRSRSACFSGCSLR